MAGLESFKWDFLGFAIYLMFVWLWWQENGEEKGEVVEMLQASAEVGISVRACCFACINIFFYFERACADLS